MGVSSVRMMRDLLGEGRGMLALSMLLGFSAHSNRRPGWRGKGGGGAGMSAWARKADQPRQTPMRVDRQDVQLRCLCTLVREGDGLGSGSAAAHTAPLLTLAGCSGSEDSG